MAAVTVDVHDDDRAEDIDAAANVLAAEGVRATFFVPAALFGASRAITGALRALPRLRHEVGSHGYHHSWGEVEALTRGKGRSGLSFLQTARSRFEEFYGFVPMAFRAPVWCRPNDAALDELVRLGYAIDSSATPQRLPVLSSYPFRRGWLWSRRSPYLIRPHLLEVPTTTAVLPAGSMTFRLLRHRLSLFFVRVLLAEKALFRRRTIVVQFHSADLSPHAVRQSRRPVEGADFLLKRRGGFAFRSHLLECDPSAVTATAWKVVRLLSPTATLSEVRGQWLLGGRAEG
jgi:hypothetical protein